MLSALTNIDDKFLKSLRLLLFSPGTLTKEYFAGRRSLYVKPLVLFAVMNVIYFVIQPVENINSFNSTLRMQTRDYDYSSWVKGIVDARVTESEFPAFEAVYNAKSEQLAKTLIIIQVPLLTMFVALLGVRKGMGFLHHLIFSTHFYAFMLVLNIIGTIGVFIYFKLGGNEYELGIPFVASVFIYLIFALRKAYDDGVAFALIKSGLLAIGVVIVLILYRFMLFWMTFWSV